MNQSDGVRCVECIGDLPGEFECLGNWQTLRSGPRNALRERFALDQFHGDRANTIRVLNTVMVAMCG